MDLTDAKSVVQDVFESTGLKIEVDDPLVAAALLNSRVQLRAAEGAAAVLQRAVTAAAGELAQAARAEREAAAAAGETFAETLKQVRASIEAGGDNELSSLRLKFAQSAQETLRDVASKAGESAPDALKWKIAAFLCAGGLLFALAGGVVGAAFFGRQDPPSLEQQREIAAGRDFLAILPKLDGDTRSKVVKLVEASHRQ